MAALLVGLAVMSVLMSVALPVWRQQAQREKEAELVFRGEQYARAIGLFQRKYAGAFPPSIDVLVEQKFLRRKYKDPMVEDGEFQVLYQTQATAPGMGGGGAALPGTVAPGLGQTPPAAGASQLSGTATAGPRGGVIGVTSRSDEESIRLYQGRGRYNEWQFVYTQVSQQGGTTPGAAPGQATPGQTPAQPTPGTGGGFGRPGGIGGAPTGPGPRPGSGPAPAPFTVPAPNQPGQVP